MQPFMVGIGLIAVEARAPVVPLKLHIYNSGFPWQCPFVRRGKVEIRFGKPITFSRRTSYLEATKAIEEAVRSL